jgi:hypothetical protein
LGDGCRYCQPQNYIDILEEQIEEDKTEHQTKLTDKDLVLIEYLINDKIDQLAEVQNKADTELTALKEFVAGYYELLEKVRSM